MKLFIIGDLEWKQTQLIYHALAYENIESLVLSSPIDTYLSVGLHQNPKDELDLKYCIDNNIGIFRREIGGGTVLLDNNQLFYNLILNRNNPKVPYAPEAFFRRFLQPVIQTYHELGISVEYRPLCDLVVNERKISGNGGGEIGDCKVLGGSILLDFNYELMSRAVNLTDDLRKRFLELMKINLTTVNKELGFNNSKEDIYNILATKYQELLGPMNKVKLDLKIKNKMTELDKQYSSDKWLFQKGTKQIWREIKVREGVLLLHKLFNTQNNQVAVTCLIEKNKIKNVTFSNRFLQSNDNQHEIENIVIDRKFEGIKSLNEIVEIIKSHGGVITD
jgi:lipoate-protein ligase A